MTRFILHMSEVVSATQLVASFFLRLYPSAISAHDLGGSVIFLTHLYIECGFLFSALYEPIGIVLVIST